MKYNIEWTVQGDSTNEHYSEEEILDFTPEKKVFVWSILEYFKAPALCNIIRNFFENSNYKLLLYK